MKLLIKELKGYSYRILDVETSKTFRAMKKDFDFCVGSLLDVQDFEASGDLIIAMTIIKEIVGDTSKARVELDTEEYKIGDLYDGVPILSFGRSYAKAGKKMAYAYFK